MAQTVAVTVNTPAPAQNPLWRDLPYGTLGTVMDPKTGTTHTMYKVFAGGKFSTAMTPPDKAIKKAGGFRLVSLNDPRFVCSPVNSANWSAFERPLTYTGPVEAFSVTAPAARAA